MFKNLLIPFFTILIGFISAQTGRISGTILDSKTGETLPGATALIEGTTKGASADFDGKFSINNVPVGKVTLIINYISYDSKKITNIEVKAGDATDVNVQLNPSTSQDLAEVEVVVTLNKENNTALILQQKNNASVSDGISAETIKRSPDKNTSDVLKRVSGATIQDGKFAIIRGLNDRYNAAYLNGSPLPSTETNRKSFAFDVFPSNMLDALTITKTARPDLPGEFAGGIIEVTTKSIPEKNFISCSAGAGYNNVTTFKNQLYYNGGKKDWIGLDDGTRALPKNMPTFEDYSVNINTQAQYAKDIYTGDWGIRTKKFQPNSSFQIASGYNFKLKERDFFGLLASVSYNNTNSYLTTERNNFYSGRPNDPNDPLIIDKKYLDETYLTQKLIGVLVNASCKINSNNSISSKNLYSINSEDLVNRRTGAYGLNTDTSLLKGTLQQFTQNKIYSSQLIGEHFIPKAKVKINWTGANSNVKRLMPNQRRNLYSKRTRLINYAPPGDDPIYNPQDTVYSALLNSTGSSGSDYSGMMLWSELTENIKSIKLDVSRSFKATKDITIDGKIGGLYQIRSREADLRQFIYTTYQSVGGSQPVVFNSNITFLDENHIFQPENMGIIAPSIAGANGVGGLKLEEASAISNYYGAKATLAAGYAMADIKYKTFLRLIGGARVESYEQTLRYRSKTYGFDKTYTTEDTTVIDFLPSIGVIISPTDKQNFRLNYSKTINRPEFREIAPLYFYDLLTQFSLQGYTKLKRATINNYDLRYEIFPGGGQLASVSGFYKDFTNAIEVVHLLNDREVSYRNAPKSTCYGAELEYRINLGIFTKNDTSLLGRFLHNLTLYSNLSLIKSKTDIIVNNGPNIGQKNGERVMQGQSPYIVNVGLSYIDTKYNYSFSASYNKFGPRLYFVGNGLTFNDLWELGRNVIDLQVTKGFWKNRLELKFNIKDLIAKKQPQRFYQEFDNKVGYSPTGDAPFWLSRFGAVYSFIVSFKF